MNYILVHEKPTGDIVLLNLDNVLCVGVNEDNDTIVRFLGSSYGFPISETFGEIQDMISSLKRRGKHE